MEVQNRQFGPEGPRSLWRNRVFSAGLAMFYAGARLLRLDRRGRRNALDIQLVGRSISFPDLPRAFDGYRILHLSDTHLDCLPELAAVASRLITGIEVDLLALTGDIHGRQRAPLADSTGPLAELIGAVRVKDRHLAILGNHDHWTDAKLITDLFRAENIRVLVNEGTRVDLKRESFWLAGVDDTMVGLEDLPLALAGSRDHEFKLLLAHNPMILRRAARASVDLVLSGHTHGGQVTWRSEKSRSGRPRRRMLRGLGRRGNTQIYVTRGLGTVVLPIRYGCPPEISVLELRAI